MNRKYRKTTSTWLTKIARPNFWVIAVVFVSAPFVFRAAGTALSQRDNDVRQWLPQGFEETQRYDWFLEHFESEEFALASWEGAAVDDQRVSQLAEALRAYIPRADGDLLEPAGDRAGQPTWFRKIVTGPDLLAQLQDRPLMLSRSKAVERLQGSLLGRDGKTTGLLTLLSPEGQADRHRAVETIYAEAEQLGVARDQLRLGGPTIDSVALDQESERSRHLLSILSLVLGSLAAWRCLREFRLVAVVLLTSIYCGAATLAWVHVFGDKLNLVMVTMPTLVYVLTISGAIHMTHYYKKAASEDGQQSAASRALAAGWLPCALTALTTAVGLGSLMVSHVTPVRLFGFYSAMGVVTSLPVVLFFVPAILSQLERDRSIDKSVKAIEPATMVHTGGLAQALGAWVVRWHAPIAVVGIIWMLVSLGGLTRLTTSVKLTNFFSPNSRVIADYRWLEENLAPLVPIEVVLRLPRDEESRILDRVELASRVQAALAALPHVDGAISAATFAPPIPVGGGFRQVTQRSVINKELAQNRDRLIESGYLKLDGEDELWRISARVAALNDIDYGQFIDRMRSAVQPVLSSFGEQGDLAADDVEAVYTGVVPLIYKAQRVLLEDLINSFLLAFGIIAVVMLLLMNGLAAGLISMLPNTFPVAVVFGSLGWLGQVCDIGAMITASVALGIAVDDTIHFLSWFRRGMAEGMSRRQAIIESYRRCGKAMLQTTVICGLGMLGFAFSSFAPTARFALLMVTLLLAALVGDLLFLPALLAGPLGSLFKTTKAKTRTAAHARWGFKALEIDRINSGALVRVVSQPVSSLRLAASRGDRRALARSSATNNLNQPWESKSPS